MHPLTYEFELFAEYEIFIQLQLYTLIVFRLIMCYKQNFESEIVARGQTTRNLLIKSEKIYR